MKGVHKNLGLESNALENAKIGKTAWMKGCKKVDKYINYIVR